jgi:serine/threonine protein kinase
MGTERVKPPPLPPGTRLDDRFEVVERLGSGNFGEVYRARQVVFGRTLRDVALKLFMIESFDAGHVIEALGDAFTLIGLQEEDPMQEVARHMVQVYDIGLLRSPREQAFMSMRLVPGRKTLDTAISRWRRGGGGMPVELTLRYLRQLLIPLAWMHTLEVPVVHGDLKPDNILLLEDFQGPRLIVTDFGLAARLPLGSLGGAVQYLSPEALAGEPAHAHADIYAVGLILYEMLTGCHPFADVDADSSDNAAYMRAHFRERKRPIKPASDINKELLEHPQLEAMLNRCLCFRQSERYSNARLLLMELDRYIQRGVASGGGSTATEPPTPHVVIDREKMPELLVADANSLLQQGRHDEALDFVGRALQSKPRLVPALLLKARVHTAQGDTGAARVVCFEAQKLARQDPEVFKVLAEIYAADGQHDMARNMRLQEQRLRGGKTNGR